MISVNILTKGFDTPNGLAFLFPIILFKKVLNEKFKIKIYFKIIESIECCDILLIESKFYRNEWKYSKEEIIQQFISWKKKKIKVIFCDTTDSSSWIKSDILNYVFKYAKGQLLKNKDLYLKKIYANRVYAEYYFKNKKVLDIKEEYSIPIKKKHLSKLCVSWNSGLANYSIFSPIVYRYTPPLLCDLIFKFSNQFVSPYRKRNLINCRFGSMYHLKSIRYQRDQMKKILKGYLKTDKLNRFSYFNEMKKTLLSIVPFGYGEITLKDFESFLNGCILMKPRMNHMETWPNFYIPEQTFISFPWNFDGLQEKIEEVRINPKKYLHISQRGQNLYKKYTIHRNAAELFFKQFSELVS